MPPFRIRHIDHLVFRVADLARSIHFYEQILGCTIVKRRPELGLVHLRAGSSMVDLIAVSGRLGSRGGIGPGNVGRNVDHLCLRVDPFEPSVLLAHLKEHGIEPLGPIEMNFGAEGDGPSLYIKDPDQNVVELKGPSALEGRPMAGTPG